MTCHTIIPCIQGGGGGRVCKQISNLLKKYKKNKMKIYRLVNIRNHFQVHSEVVPCR